MGNSGPIFPLLIWTLASVHAGNNSVGASEFQIFPNNHVPPLQSWDFLDTREDIKSFWTGIETPGRESWYVYVNYTKDLGEKDLDTPFNQWKDLKPTSEVGTWALFYQNQPPIDDPFPYMRYFNRNITWTYRSLIVSYFMYGNVKIDVFNDTQKIGVIENNCGRGCPLDFRTVQIDADLNPYIPGSRLIHLNLTVPDEGDFILIDKISALDDTGATMTPSTSTTRSTRTTSTPITSTTPCIPPPYVSTPPPDCSCYACVEKLDIEDDLTELFWQISDSLRYFQDVEEIQEKLGSSLPTGFQYDNFKDAEGIWVFRKVGSNDRIEGIRITDEYPFLDILLARAYIHSGAEIFVYGDSDVVYPWIAGEKEEWHPYSHKNLVISNKLRMEIVLTEPNAFVFIDSVQLNRDMMQCLPNGNKEICVCATELPHTTKYPPWPVTTPCTVATNLPTIPASETTASSTKSGPRTTGRITDETGETGKDGSTNSNFPGTGSTENTTRKIPETGGTTKLSGSTAQVTFTPEISSATDADIVTNEAGISTSTEHGGAMFMTQSIPLVFLMIVLDMIAADFFLAVQ